MSYRDDWTGQVFESRDEYLQSIKQGDSYSFSYDYEYVADRFGEGDDDVRLETARVNIDLSWDDTSPPGYLLAYHVDSPTPIPNDWTGDASELFEEVWLDLNEDLMNLDISAELYKDWTV